MDATASPHDWVKSFDSGMTSLSGSELYPTYERTGRAKQLGQQLEAATEAQAFMAQEKLKLTALHQVAAQGRVDWLQDLLDRAADPLAEATATDVYGNTPALWAAMCGHFDAVALLAEVAPDTYNDMSRQGVTLLHWAAAHGDTDAVEMLLDDEPWTAYAEDTFGSNPLHWAAFLGHADVVQQILSAAPHAAAAKTIHGRTPLFLAAREGHLHALQRILDADPPGGSTVDNLGMTPLHLLLLSATASPCLLECVQLLLHSAPEAAAVVDDLGGNTPLHWAVHGAEPAVPMLLAAAPGSAAQRDFDGMLPLHLAAGSGRELAVAALITAYPEALTKRDGNGKTPLHRAVGSGQQSVVQLLLAASPPAALTAVDFSRNTLLHGAVDGGEPSVVSQVLAATPAAVAAKNAKGHTPLAVALALQPAEAWRQPRIPAAAVMMAAGPADAVLDDLCSASPDVACQLLPGFIAAHGPLTDAQWARIPAPYPGLGRALPAALACSEDQARQLVRRLPQADAQRLRTAALSLARPQLGSGLGGQAVYLPSPIAQRILSTMFDA